MLIVDSQVHIWGANTPERPWPARAHAQREIPLGHEQLLKDMDEAGINRVVIVPPSWEGDRNDLAIEAVKQHPDRFAIMVNIGYLPAERKTEGKRVAYRICLALADLKTGKLVSKGLAFADAEGVGDLPEWSVLEVTEEQRAAVLLGEFEEGIVEDLEWQRIR